jgi:hypothetical protein
MPGLRIAVWMALLLVLVPLGIEEWISLANAWRLGSLIAHAGSTDVACNSGSPADCATGIVTVVGNILNANDGISVNATNPTVGNNPTFRRAVDVNCTNDTSNLDKLYTQDGCFNLFLTAQNGQNSYNAGTNGKSTFAPFAVTETGSAAGQKFLYNSLMNCYGMGDCAIWGERAVYYAGGPINGDEGTGWAVQAHLIQQPTLTRASIVSVPTPSSCNTTLTQDEGVLRVTSYAYNSGTGVVTLTMTTPVGAVVSPGDVLSMTGMNLNSGGTSLAGVNGNQTVITASGSNITYNAGTGIAGTPSGGGLADQGLGYAPKTVTVASGAGCLGGDWVIVNQVLPGGNYGTPNAEAVHIISATTGTPGTITAVFKNNQISGAAVQPAKVLNLDSTYQFGQQRILVNLSSSSTYSTGTVSSITGGAFTGTSTSWTSGMVGGNTSNIGCVALDADTYTGAPFSAGSGALLSWYEILSVASTTSMAISTTSTGGDTSYHGLGPGPGGSGSSPSTYTVRPCIQVLYLNSGNQIIAESTTTTWSPGDQVELAISAYPDVNGYALETMAQWNPGGAHNARAGHTLVNNGARQFEFGYAVTTAMAVGGNADTVGWDSAFAASGANYGLTVGDAAKAAIQVPGTAINGRIIWGNQLYMEPNTTNGGIDFQMDSGGSYPGNGGFLRSYGHNSGVLGPSNSEPGLSFGGVFGTVPKTFSQLMPCTSAVEGFESAVTDSTASAFGSTITGMGMNHVKAYCNGTNWTVH